MASNNNSGGSAQMIASQVTTDPVTGEVVGGLSGLREIMRAKRELDESRTSDTVRDDAIPNDKNQLKLDIDRPVKRARRRNKKSHREAGNSKTAPAYDDFFRQIDPAKVLYAEVKNANEPDAMFYLLTDDGVVTYTKQLFDHSWQADFCRGLGHQLRRHKQHYAVTEVGDYVVYLNREDDKLSAGEQSLVYAGRFALKSSSPENFEAAKSLMKQIELAPIVTPNEHESKKDETRNDEDAKGSEMKAGTVNIVDKLIELNKITAEQKTKVSSKAVMAAFILLGQASVELIEKLFALPADEAGIMIASLRRMAALGDKQPDGNYKILLQSIDEYDRLEKWRQDNPVESFRTIVHPVKVKGKMLTYDLAELDKIEDASALLSALASYCNLTRNHAVGELFMGEATAIQASEVLVRLSGDSREDLTNMAHLDQFNQVVTKNLLARGGFFWFPSAILGVKQINNLRMDITRYLLINLPWIQAVYDKEALLDYAKAYGAINISDSRPEEEMLRREYIRRAIGTAGKTTPKTLTDEIERYIEPAKNDVNEVDGGTSTKTE